MRYTINSKIQFDEENRHRFYESRIDPIIPKSIDDFYIVTTYGDRLDLLSHEYYRNSKYWWVITAANPELRKDSFFLEPGIQLRIFANLDEALTLLEEINRDR